jgi:hypothetical protein
VEQLLQWKENDLAATLRRDDALCLQMLKECNKKLLGA